MENNKVIIITAPSGSGKTTLVKRLLAALPELSFSISACTRAPRAGEIDGKDYYFITVDKFKEHIEKEAFIEWEMVYEGKYYGTLKIEFERIWKREHYPLVDIDVVGALNVKKQYPENSLSVFIKAPSVEELRKRLEKRGTETPETLEERVGKAEKELDYAPLFDKIIVNDDLETATVELISTVKTYLS
ncbi:MAG: guanylate kinase [Flavipsychrobacter sp.]